MNSNFQVLQCDKAKKKVAVTPSAPASIPPRQRASTLGVITEIQDGSQKQNVPTSSGRNNSNNRLNRSRNLSSSSSNSSLHGSDSKNLSNLPVVAGIVKISNLNLTLFSGGFCSSILRKTHFAKTWAIFFKIQILTLPGLKNLQL